MPASIPDRPLAADPKAAGPRRSEPVGRTSRAGPQRDAPRSNRRSQESTVKRKALGVAVFLILALSALNALFGDRGVLGLIAAREEYRALASEIASISADNQKLASEIHALRSNPLAIERRAREVLGMARPDEIVLRIESAPRGREPSPSPP